MKIYTLIGGVNGAGKSSLTGSLRSERSDFGVVIDPDKLTLNAAAMNTKAENSLSNVLNAH